MGLKEVFKKQGGFKLIKQFCKGGAFGTAIGTFLLLGKSRTALEILRLSTQFKIKNKLAKKYKRHLIEFDDKYQESLPHEQSNKVWVCWFQGMENAPSLVQRCYRSIKENMPDKEVIVLTDDNINDYVDFPDFIIKKWKSGIITHTHMTDLLRLELLIKHGGMWIDATVFCSSNDIPSFYFESDLFFYQCLKPGRDGHCTYISSWLMSAKTNNKILMAARYLCYEYWKKNDSMIDYFLLHEFLSMVLEFYPNEWNNIVPKDNATPHILLLRFFEECNEQMYNNVVTQSPFHKLSYKFTKEQIGKENTYYKRVLG